MTPILPVTAVTYSKGFNRIAGMRFTFLRELYGLVPLPHHYVSHNSWYH